MGIFRLSEVNRENVTYFVSKWRGRIFPSKGSTIPKTVDLDSSGFLADEKLEVPLAGSEPIVKTLYEGRDSRPSAYNWVDHPPRQISKSTARAQNRAAINVYKIKDREKPCIGGRFRLRYHQIEIQNPLLVALLEPMAKKENVLLDIHEPATFSYPFRVLWFCRDDILDTYNKMDASDPVKLHVKLLLWVMGDMFSELKVRQIHFKENGLVDFKHAWTLFPRGSTIYSYELNAEFLGKVETTRYDYGRGGECLIIKVKTMTFNGDSFVWKDKELVMLRFAGYKPVGELAHYPLSFHPEGDAIKARCIARGKKMLDLQGLTYCCYKGIALENPEDPDRTRKHNVEGRVLIDTVGYNKYHLNKGSREDSDPKSDKNCATTPNAKAAKDGSNTGDKSVQIVRQYHLSDEEQLANKKAMLSCEDDLGFMSELVGGYALNNKIWSTFSISHTKAIWFYAV